jgi:hypothetical protein
MSYILEQQSYTGSDRAVDIVTGYELDSWGVRVKSLGTVKNFLFFTAFQLTLRPPAAFCPMSEKAAGVKLTNHFQLMLR